MFILVYLIFCALVGLLGHRHRWLGFWGIFAISLLFTPLIGLVIVVLTHGGYGETDEADEIAD
ncbi:MAG: hypothetical protein GXY61_08845 [Lentisphaerae bacterium]|nr:hypothetical protein [Lentisphaerota bacterium]